MLHRFSCIIFGSFCEFYFSFFLQERHQFSVNNLQLTIIVIVNYSQCKHFIIIMEQLHHHDVMRNEHYVLLKNLSFDVMSYFVTVTS